LSLACFTLSIQSAIGLIWVGTTASWLAHGEISVLPLRFVITALALVALGLICSLTHLAKPRLAPHALRNLAVSWLSREVLLVQMFAGVVILIIPASLLKLSTGQIVLAITACLLGAMALYAMTRVYLLRTVPVWNSAATPLEFVGSAALLGGAFATVLISLEADGPAWKPEMMAAGVGLLLGLILKITAMPLALSAEKEADTQTWHNPPATKFSTGRVWLVRMALNLTGLLLLLAAMDGDGLNEVGACLCLICIGIGEALGRVHFYKAYRRIGL